MYGKTARPTITVGLMCGLLWMPGCGAEGAKAITDGTIDTSVEVDVDAPIIDHVPIDSAQPIAQAVAMRAVVTDELSAIDAVTVTYKRSDAAEWSSAPLEPSDEDDTWVGAIPGDAVNGSNIFYYLSATDASGNEGFYPVDGEANPVGFRVNPDA